MYKKQNDFYNTSEEYFKSLSSQQKNYFLPYLDFVKLYSPNKCKLLDLGCGTGQSTELLKKLNYNVTGLDGCGRFIDEAKKNFPKNKYIYSQAELLPIESESFDCVSSYNTIEHLVKLSQVIKEIHRILKPKGILIIHAPNLLSILHPINAVKKYNHMTYEGKKNSIEILVMAIRNFGRLFF